MKRYIKRIFIIMLISLSSIFVTLIVTNNMGNVLQIYNDYMLKNKLHKSALPIVLNTLKSPSTAIFCSANELELIPLKTADSDDSIPDDEEDVYMIRGWVDSQNSFGAMLRTKWSLVFLAKDNSPIVESLQFDGAEEQ